MSKLEIQTYFNKKLGNYVPFYFYFDENGKTSQPAYIAVDGTRYSRINITNNTPFNFAETTTTVNFSGGPAILQIITGDSTTFFGENYPITYQFSPDLNFPKDVPYVQTTAILDFQQNSWLVRYLKDLYKKLFSPNPLYVPVITEGIDAP